MDTRVAALALLCVAVFSARVTAADFPEKWVYLGSNVADQRGLDNTLAVMKEAKALGCTHIQLNDGGMAGAGRATPQYLENVKKVLAAAREMNLTIVPGIYAIGYSGRYLGRNPDLVAGIPVRDMPYVIRDGSGSPAPELALKVVNPGFEEVKDGKLAAWSEPTLPGFISVDTAFKHSGKASLKVANVDKLPKESGGAVSVSQTLKVKPFQYYYLTVWTKSDGIQATGEGYLYVKSQGGKRTNGYTNLGVESTENWTRHVTFFNTLEATEITISVGVSEAVTGAVWFDDLEIAPAGLLNVVRRELTPLKVTSADGKTLYEEGKDFAAIRAGDLGAAYDRSTEGAAFRLTEGSRIKDGQTVLISFFHTALIYDDQMGISMEDPRVFDIMEAQMKHVAAVWPTDHYFMNYDEIRIGGWENQPGGAQLKPGQELAKHVERGIAIVRKYAPEATIYVWSDMFNPYHNARPFSTAGYYYLVNGNWDGSWEGLPKDVVIANWYSPTKDGMKFFADRGHKQFMCGYYDGDMKQNISSWMKVSEGVPNVIGMMYTTWRHNYRDMPEFFRLLKEYPAWLKEPSAESSLKEK